VTAKRSTSHAATATASFVLEFLSFSPIVGREQPGIKIMMKTM
jgi:hypothetical protein